MKKLIAVIAMLCLIVLSSLSTTAEGINPYSDISNNEFSEDVVNFLEEHNVELIENSATFFTNIGNVPSLNSALKSLIKATETYNFTDEQIQAYYNGLVNTPTQIIEEPSIVSFSNDDENNTHIREDDDGIGWEVTTKDGYYESTAYLTLPTVVGKVSNTCPYMFYTFSSDNGFYIDVGICYEGGSAGLGWRGCYNVNGQLYAPNVIAGLSAGSKVYFHATIDENGFLRFRIINPNNLADVYYDISYYVYDKGIYRSNAIINRQITLCDSTKQYNCGTAIYNAKFENAYVYSSSNYALTTSVNCDESKCGKFGTNDVNINQVTETMDCKWYAENVSISF